MQFLEVAENRLAKTAIPEADRDGNSLPLEYLHSGHIFDPQEGGILENASFTDLNPATHFKQLRRSVMPSRRRRPFCGSSIRTGWGSFIVLLSFRDPANDDRA